jgi:hypothetical protein
VLISRLIHLAFGSQRMPSRVAASLVASLEHSSKDGISDAFHSSVYDVIIYHTVRMYEDYGVRLGLQKSVSTASFTVIELLRRRILERTLVAPTFDATAKESAIELAYRLVLDIRTLFNKEDQVSVTLHDLL